MQWAKVFTLNGKQKIQLANSIALICGCLGAGITFLGLYQTPEQAQMYYVAGAALILVTAVYYKLIYFIALEIILLSGHGSILFEINSKLQFILPILLSSQLLLFYYLSGQLTNLFIIIGIAGIAFLSIGFAYHNQMIFFAGSTAIAIYAFYASRTTKAALLWGILNTVFSVYAISKLIQI